MESANQIKFPESYIVIQSPEIYHNYKDAEHHLALIFSMHEEVCNFLCQRIAFKSNGLREVNLGLWHECLCNFVSELFEFWDGVVVRKVLHHLQNSFKSG